MPAFWWSGIRKSCRLTYLARSRTAVVQIAYQIQKLRNVASQLNAVLASAAAAAGVDYVSTLNAFKGHELCTGQSDLNPVGIGQWAD